MVQVPFSNNNELKIVKDLEGQSKQQLISSEKMLANANGEGGYKPTEEKSREVITLPDGTKVIRVQKRKRVTQEGKFQKLENRFLKKTLLGALALLFFFSIVIGGYSVYQVSQVGSPEYVAKWEKIIAQEWGAEEVFLKGVSATPMSLTVAEFRAKFNNHLYLKHVKIEGLVLETDFLSLFVGRWLADKSIARSVALDIEVPVEGSILPVSSDKDDARALPMIAIKRLRSSQVLLTVAQKGLRMLTTKDLDAEIRWDNKGNFLLYLDRGKIEMTGLPSQLVYNGIVKSAGNKLELMTLPFVDESNSILWQLSGQYSYGASLKNTFKLEADKLPLEVLTGKALAKLVEGQITVKESPFGFGFSPLGLPYYSLDAEVFQLSFRNFGFLSSLSQLFNAESYRDRVKFISTQKMRIVSDAAGLQFKNIDVKETNLIALSGNISILEENKLTGKLLVGVPDAMALRDDITMAHPIFTQQRNGYFWFSTELSGTSLRPMDTSLEAYKKAESIRLDQRAKQMPKSIIDRSQQSSSSQNDEKNELTPTKKVVPSLSPEFELLTQ